MDFPNLIPIGVAAFVATNIDDIFLLIVFFSSSAFPVRQIVLGQFIGIGLLVVIGVLGSLLPLIIPSYVIGLLGIVPIAIGVKKLVQLIKKEDKISKLQNVDQKRDVTKAHRSYLSFLSVTTITFSNGGDNIGVYTPLFARYNSISEIIVLVTIFMVMTAVWCLLAYYLVNHPLIANRIRRVGHIILPFVMIGLGIYILIGFFL